VVCSTPGPRQAERGRVGLRELERAAAGVLVDGDEARDALALLVHAAHDVAGRLRRDQHRVDARVGRDQAEVDVEAVAEDECVAGADRVGETVGPHALLRGVRCEHDDHVSLVGGRVRVQHAQALLLGDRREPEPARRPTRTSMPESRRFSAWAWPWLP
jgi:hypothetical protein